MTEAEYITGIVRGMWGVQFIIDTSAADDIRHKMRKVCEHLEMHLENETLLAQSTGAEQAAWRDALARGRAWLEANDA